MPPEPKSPEDLDDEVRTSLLVRIVRSPLFHYGLALAILVLDFSTGPLIQFPIMFIIPVGLAAWYSSLRSAIFLSIVLPAARMYFAYTWRNEPQFVFMWDMQILNFFIRVTVLFFMAYLVSRTSIQHRELARRLRYLSGTIPICFHCKKMQDKTREWQEPEVYVTRHSEATFVPSLCPTCAEKDFGDILGKEDGQKS